MAMMTSVSMTAVTKTTLKDLGMTTNVSLQTRKSVSALGQSDTSTTRLLNMIRAEHRSRLSTQARLPGSPCNSSSINGSSSSASSSTNMNPAAADKSSNGGGSSRQHQQRMLVRGLG